MKGQSFLALILLVGAIVTIIAVTVAFFAGVFLDSGYGYQASAMAEAVAMSGAQDALLQLNRNANFATSSYSLAVGSTTATISVTQNVPWANLITVSSTATVSGRTRKVSVVLSKNAVTSQIVVVSWQEIQ